MLSSLFNAASSKSPRSPRDPSPRDFFSLSKKNTDTKLFLAVIHDRRHQTLTFAMVHSEITMKILKRFIKTAYTDSDVIDLVPNRYATLENKDANYGQNHLEELVCFTQKNLRKQGLTNPHFNAIFCFSESNFAFPGEDVCPPFLHNRTTLTTIFEPFFVAPEHVCRFLITGTTEVYQQSLAFFTRDALTHEHTIHKDRTRDLFKLFQDSYKAVIALATRPHMSPLGIINHASGNLFQSHTHTRQANIDVTMFTDLTIGQDAVPTVTSGSERFIRQESFTLVAQPLVETSNMTTEGRTVSPCQQLSYFLSGCCCWSILSPPISPMSNAPQPAAM